MAKKLRYSGEIPRIPIDADTSAADQKLDRLFNRVDNLQRVKIDVDVSMAQRRLETMIKRTNKQMSSDLVSTMLKDFKTVLGAAKTEFEKVGESDIFKGLEKTCNMVEDRFSNLTISIDKKQIAGLENILNTAKEIQSISGFSFGDVVSKQTVKNTKAVLSDVRATKKEINSIVNKIDYIQKTLDKSSKSALSTDKLNQYEKRLQNLGNSLKGFYGIEDELVQNALVNATSKINKAIGDIQIRMPKVQIGSDASSDKATFKNLATEEKKAKAIQEVANRISTHSSIKGLKNLHQEAVNVTKVLGEMYDEGIRDTERYITLQYKLQKIFDKLGKGYGGVRGSGAKNSSELLDLVIDGIKQKTGVNLFSSSGFAGVMENLFGDADFSLFNKSLSKLGMKDVAELLLITGKTGDWVDIQKQVTVEVEKTADALSDQSKVSKSTANSLDELRDKYFSIIKTVETYLELMEKFNKLEGNTWQKARKNMINFISDMPQDVFEMLGMQYGEKFTEGFKNSFKGISTKDLFDMIRNPSNSNAMGALKLKLDLAKAIDFDNIQYTDDGKVKLSGSDNPFEQLGPGHGVELMNELYNTLGNIVKIKQEELSLTKQIGQEEAKNVAIQKKKALNMETVIKRYNALMNASGAEHMTIGTDFSTEDTKGWGISEMVEEAKYWLSTFYENGHVNEMLRDGDSDEKKEWRSITAKFNRFIDAYKPYVNDQSQQQNLEDTQDKILSVTDAIQRLNELSQDPWKIKSEEEVNNILKERLDIIEKIGEAKLKAHDAEEFEGIKNVNEYYSDRLDGFKELRDDNIYRQLDEQYGYIGDRIDSSKELEVLLENRIDLMGQIYFKEDDLYREYEKQNQAIRERIALMKELEPLVAKGVISNDTLEELVFERGTLDERRSALEGVQQDLFNLDDADLDEAQELLRDYEKILVTTAGGKKLELGPEMSEKDYKAFMKADMDKAKSIEFVRKKQEQLTGAIEETVDARKEEAKATEEAAEAKIKYYEIDENAARIAKQMRSFDDYKEGSATASYRAAVDEIAAIVEEKKHQFPDKSEQLDQLLDRYAKNLAAYINRDNQIGAQYPSVMISGAGNYNIKKHNRQMASWGKNYQFYDEKVLALENKIRNLGSSGTEVIRGDEENALEKLEAKLEYMKYWHEIMVAVNKYYKKNKTLEGFEGVEPDELERIKKDLAIIKQVGMYDTPYPSYALTNDSQNIKRIEGRVAELKRLKDSDGLQEENDIYKLWTDKKDMRIRISFEMGKPDQEVIDILKGKAFKWSRKNGAWQRQLTSNAIYDTKQIQKSLHDFYQIEEQSNAATAAIEAQTKATEQLTEARLKLIPKKDGSGKYTAMDGKYEIGQDAEGWKVFQRDNAGLWNLIGTYEHFEDIKNDVSLLTREEIVRTDEVIQEIKTLQEAYQSLRTETGGYIPLVNKYTEVLGEVKNGAMSAADAIAKLNEVMHGGSVKKQDTSLSDNMSRINTLGEFTQSNAELFRQFLGTEQYDVVIKKVEEISKAILSTGTSLEEANKQLQEFVGGLEKSGEVVTQPQAINRLPQLVDNYGKSLDEVNNKLMQGTKLLNEQGQILRLFHNSSEIFDKFDATKAGSNQGQALGKGNYLALSQNGEFNGLDYGRYQTQWYANVQNPFNVRDRLTDKQSAEVIDKFLGDRAEGFKQHMLGKLRDGDIVEAVKDIARESKTAVGEIFGHLGYDAIMDGAQINVFDPSKIHRANNSVLDIGTGEFDAFRDLRKKIWEEQKIIRNANDQIKKLSNQYAGQTQEQLDTALLGETLLRAWNWRDNVAKIASELKALTGELPKVDGISEESMRAMVENYEFSRQNLQSYIDERTKHEKILEQLNTQYFNQEEKIHAATQSYLKGNIGGIVNKEASKETTVQADAAQKVLDTESKLTPVIEENTAAKQKQVEQANAQLEAEKQVTAEFEKQQDIMQQALLEEFDDIGYASPYTSEQIGQLTDGIKLEKIFKRYGVAKENRPQIVEKFNQWASMIAEQREFERNNIEPVDDLPTMIDETMSEIVDMIQKLGSTREPIQKTLESFYEYAKGIRIQYNASDVAEFGSDWPQTLREFGRGRYAALTQDRSALTINKLWGELTDAFPNLFSSSMTNEKDQLKKYIEVLRAARKEHSNKAQTEVVDLPDYAFDNIMFDLSGSYQAIESNTDKMLNSLDAAIQKENMLGDAAERTAHAIEGQGDAAKYVSDTLSNVSVEEIVSREINSALEQLRSAKNNETTLFSLKGVFDGEDLVNQAHAMIENIAEQANLSLGKFTVKDNIIRAQLYNEELKIAVDQTYQLVAATEEMESSQLRLVSQSFSQNVNALNENNFDIEGMQARALAAIEKTRSSLHGLAYDLTDLENMAKSISSQDDFTKFNNQLKAADDNIQAIKNSTVSKSSMNPLANMQRDMKNASIEIETMRLKLEKFGDIKGVDNARQMLDEMVAAAKEYNAATDAQGQQAAYNRFSDVRSSFKAQTEYIKAAQDLNKAQVTSDKQADPIREQYQSILDLVNKINTASNRITSLKKEDRGTGILSGKIEQVKAEKEQLITEIQGIANEINNTLSSGFVEGKSFSIPSVSFLQDSGVISSFLSDVRTQASLTTAEIEALIQAFQKSENIDIKSSSKFIDQFKSVEETAKKLRSSTSLDQSNESVQALEAMYAKIMEYKERILSGDQTLQPEDFLNLNSLIEQFTKYGDILAETAAKEQKYFAGKQKYTQGTTYDSAIKGASEDLRKFNDIRSKLEQAARSYAKDSGADGSFITNFAQSADGISRLDFSVFDTATNSLRNFRMEMGSVTQGMYVTETTINKSLANIQAANKQLQSVGGLLGRLDASGVNIKTDGSAVTQVQTLLERYKALSAELAKGDGAKQSRITKLTKDLQMASAEVEKLYKSMMQTEGDIIGKRVQDLGLGDVKGDIYGQLVNATHQLKGANQAAAIEVGRFDAAQNTLNASLVHANGTVENFKLSMNGLNGQITAQQVGAGKLTNSWDIFRTTMAKAGRQLMTAFAGYNVFYKVISEVRKGIGYVKEIDLALTELKKVTNETNESYAQFLNTAAGTAGKIGSTVSDFTEATANFARLGYTMKESADMAETAIVYRNVADGLDTVGQATDSIISTMKAFGIESDNTMGIVDRFNEVGNNFAITSAGIGDALQRSASALFAGGNSIDESIALVTAANSVVN